MKQNKQFLGLIGIFKVASIYNKPLMFKEDVTQKSEYFRNYKQKKQKSRTFEIDYLCGDTTCLGPKRSRKEM